MNKWRTTAAETAFASELVQLRIEAGLNQQALAEAVGIRPDDVDLSEAGLRPVDVVELHHWCRACGYSLDGFVERMDRRLKAPRPVTH